VLLDNETAAVAAVETGVVDATFRAGMTTLPEGLLRTRVLARPEPAGQHRGVVP
jgi:hypothetical protein